MIAPRPAPPSLSTPPASPSPTPTSAPSPAPSLTPSPAPSTDSGPLTRAYIALPNGGETAVIGQSMNIIVNTPDITGLTFKLADYRNPLSVKTKNALAQAYSRSISQVALFGGDPSLLLNAMRAQLVGTPVLIDLSAQFSGQVALNQQLFKALVPTKVISGNRFKIQVFRNGVKLDEGDNFFNMVVSSKATP